MKQINKEIMDIVHENISFVFIFDGFDEIFDKYNNNNNGDIFMNINRIFIHVAKTEDIREKYFDGDSIAKYVFKKVDNHKYQFLYKSSQEYLIFFHGDPMILLLIINNFNNNLKHMFQNYLLINNIKINYAILDRVFLEGTDFTNATKVNFTNASMTDIYFGEYAYLERHIDVVKGIQFSPDGTKIVSYSNDKIIQIWDAFSRKQLHVLEGHSDEIRSAQRVNSMKFSLDDSKIISGSTDNSIRIWDVSSGTHLLSLERHEKEIISYSYNKIIRILDTLSGQQLQLLEGYTHDVNGIQLSSNGLKCLSY
ncbi:hypothetical protein RFI_04627 [Reticulomyxa filosa]|uniref:Uncharacterized protein n=1 Tax=Reticulomyxa filosa TaxID=46433 RepID=X6P1S5_RETFI|nr:hypothetical protein RFI_04627 [Reticulomyxa filosa]|eukprot:ETO32490.1 hypothetical protein RFI_04627 [Reticulomyxa filosa]